MRVRLVLLTVSILLLAPASAFASLADEQRQGQQLVARLHAGTKTCGQLSGDDFDHIGEYVMFRALGSTSLHQAMNDRMTAMMGEQGESRMHQLLGLRYAGCSNSSASAGSGGMMGQGMMGGGHYGTGGWGAMMSSGDWSWMASGGWRNMTRQDWQHLRQRLLGTNASATSGGWSPAAIVALTIGAVLLVGLAIFLLARRPFRRPPAAAASG
ncbi:MAG TPA: hypothetical protein VFH80_04185 [Solirubrobacteraceae bacterium]|nr:hypothetical protein [Solirubrobacteraceae bacterium]